jgi:hypothetical protein
MNSLVTPSATDPGTTLVPPAGLVVANPSAASDPPLFCLFTQDWLTLQTFIVHALQLPITTGNFEDKYGTFTDEQQIKDCVAAMQAIQGLSVDFGDPLALITALANDPTILQSATAPTPIYTHIVWFATKLYQAATTYNQTLGQFMTLLNPVNCGSPAQCGAMLTEVLTGQGGLQSTAKSMESLCNDLVQALAGFNLKLLPSTTAMANYTSQSSTFYADVDKAITADDNDVNTFQSEADSAYKLWRDLTISAVTTSVGVMVISCGMAWPVSATLAGVLGDQAKKARDAYDNACAQRDAASADEQKKILLKADLNGFNLQMTPVNQAATAFKDTLQQVLAVWTQIGTNLDYIVKNFTPEQLGTLSWVMQALALDRATKDWKIIADKAEEYTGNSLITYNIVNFGSPLPADTTPGG